MRKGKKITKLLSFVMAVTMMLSLCVFNVSAADGDTTVGGFNPDATTGTLTLTEKVKGKNASYSAYKVLDAIKVKGQNVYEYQFTEEFEGFAKANRLTVDQLAKMTNGLDDYQFSTNIDSVDTLLTKMEEYVNDTTKPVISEKSNITSGTPVEELELGYYLILEDKTTGSENPPEAKKYKPTKPLLVAIPSQTVKQDNGETVYSYNYDVVVNLKAQPISTVKTIEEVESEKEDSAAVQVGKEYTFKIVQDVPKYDDLNKDIKFILTDTMDKGLTLNENSISVATKTGDTTSEPLKEDLQYDVVVEEEKQEGTETIISTKMTFNFSENEETPGTSDNYYQYVKDADQVVITYTAKLNKNATFGPTGNVNEVKPMFSDGIDVVTDGDKTVNYAGELELLKVGENDKKLKGAEFTVYADEECTQKAELVTYTMDGDGKITTTPNMKLSATATTDKDGIARFAGLGAGTYYIKETKAPDGYVLLKKPIKVVVTVGLPESIKEGTEDAEFTYSVEGNGVDKITQDANGRVTIEVNNVKGFVLPITGGTGTYLLTIGGVVFLLIAVGFAVRSRRKED